MSEVVIFAPSPVLTVTVEDHPDGPDVHLHAGGQGIWQARTLLRMHANVTVCCVLTGESGRVLRHLLDDEGINVVAVERAGRSGAYIHDRRGGERVRIVETGGEPITRHDLDELYGLTLRESLDSDAVILSGPASDDALPPDVYRRLATDLRTGGRRVIVDLSGERLTAALAGGVSVVKVSSDELLADGRISQNAIGEITVAMHAIQEEGAGTVIVTRADQPVLMLADAEMSEITPPALQVADTSGAGDSLTAGFAAAIAAGRSNREAIALGAAAGALNVTRHGLGTGNGEAIEKLRKLVTVRTLTEAESTATFSPDQLAARAEESPTGTPAPDGAQSTGGGSAAR